MKLLDINDTGVGEQIVRLEVTREELESIFYYCDDGIYVARKRAERLSENTTTLMAAESLHRRLNVESDMVSVIDGIIKLFEANDSDDDPQESLV